MIAKLYRTVKDSDERISFVQKLELGKLKKINNKTIVIDNNIKYQKHIGFGGAFTEAAASTFALLSDKEQDKLIQSYYSNEGIGYNLGRVQINSSDFSIQSYTYVKDNDEELKSFDLSHEDKWVIPMVKKALKCQKEMKILASPWSPPAWMKDNNDMKYGGKLLPKYYNSWANYYIKFIDEYQKRGINIWGITVQNEPEAVQTWESCIYTATEEKEFVKNFLGPKIMETHPSVKIIGWDHNRDEIVRRAYEIFSDDEASKYFWGVGTHWYVSEEFKNLSIVHEMFPDKHIIFTEGCQEGGAQPNNWLVGERYARNIIGDLNNWLEGWIDWNLLLNEQGGPNHVENYCDAPILVDRKTLDKTYNNSYYYIGHFSKFIKPGAFRIKYQENLLEGFSLVAYENPDKEIVVVVLNETDRDELINIVLEGRGVEIFVSARSINTVVISD
ncbi:MAG: glycoside hydrolase family 30 protein [Acholeplasma sp.]|nr:glycoside hydrolase family 30 protein [Acholeplasma sp.]